MKRVITFSVMLMFLFGALTYATDTRVRTMGDANNIVMDEANVGLYPSVINYYPKLFEGEFSGSDYWKIGANWEFAAESNPFVLGTYFSTMEYQHGIVDFEDAHHRIDLFYGRNLGEIPFGFNFTYHSSGFKNEDDTVNFNSNESMSRFKFALGISPMERKLDLGAYIAFVSWTHEDFMYWNGVTDSGYVSLTEPSGNLEFGLNARYWMDPMGMYTLIPHFGIMYKKEGADSFTELFDNSWGVWRTDEETTLMFDLGLGMNYNASEEVVVIGDIGFALESFKDKRTIADTLITVLRDLEDKTTTLWLPYFRVGIDAKVLKWLDLRSGVWTRWERETAEPAPSRKRITSSVMTSTFLGAGFNWGRFYLDAEINTDFIENGPYFISGDYVDDLTERVSLKYMF